MKVKTFINLSEIFRAIYDFSVKNRIFHDKQTSGGAFTNGEVITGQTSGATATVTAVEGYSLKYTTLTGTLQVNENVIGGTSAAKCKILRFNTFHTLVSDRIYLEGTINKDVKDILPYAVYKFTGERPTNSTYHKDMSSINLRWEVFDNSVTIENMLSLISALYKLFNRAEITIDNHICHSCMLVNTSEIQRDLNNIWVCGIDYTLFVSPS